MPERIYTDAQRSALLEVARLSIEEGLRGEAPLEVDPADYDAPLRAPNACFVTLRRHGDLRGCIGGIEAVRPLVVEVAHNAFAAAFRDPRFPPVTRDELEDLTLHISVLSPLEAVSADSEAELLTALRPGVDGLLIEDGAHRGTFLPAVWEQLETPAEFVHALERKAGLPRGGWSPSYRVHRYTTESFPDE